jgi:hypothetical protein
VGKSSGYKASNDKIVADLEKMLKKAVVSDIL